MSTQAQPSQQPVRADTTERLERVFHDRLSLEPPPADMDILASGLLDSLTLVELIMSLEEEFAINIPMEELEIGDFRTVSSIERLVARHIHGQDADNL